MPLLWITQLTCFETEDPTTDEATLQINGNTIFGPHSMADGDVVAVNRFHRFTGTVAVNLLDEEGDVDDFLGTVDIPESSPLGITQVALFNATQQAALYHMDYIITP